MKPDQEKAGTTALQFIFDDLDICYERSAVEINICKEQQGPDIHASLVNLGEKRELRQHGVEFKVETEHQGK